MFVVLGGLLVIALFTALIGPLFVDWTAYKRDFEREASRIAGQPVTVSGEASVRLLPLPGVTFTDLAVGRNEDGSPMMTVEAFSMNTELMPFLSGKIRIVDMVLTRPKFTVQVRENGTVGWTDRKETLLDPDSVRLEKMRIEDASIRVDGLAGGRSFTGSGFNAEVSAQSLFGPWHIETKGEVEGKPAEFSVSTGRLSDESNIRIKLQAIRTGEPYRLSLDGQIAVKDDVLSWEGGFDLSALPVLPEMESQPLPIDLQGKFAATPNSVEVSEYRLEIGDRTDPYTITGEGEVNIREEVFFRFFADGRQIDLSRFAEDAGSDSNAGGIDRRWAALRDIVNRIPIPDANGEIDFSLPAIIAGDTVVRELQAKVRPDVNGWQISGLRTVFPGNTQVEADGKLGTQEDFGFTGQVLLASRQPTGFANWLSGRTNASLRRLKSAGMSAQVTLTDKQASFENLELILDGVRLSGRLQRLTPAGSRPAVIASLSGGAINLDDLIAIYSMTQSSSEEASLSDQDIDLTLKASLLEGRGMSAREVDAHLRIEEGALSIDSLNAADFYGASISSSGKLTDFPKQLLGNFGLSIKSDQARPLIEIAQKYFSSNRFLAALASDPALTRDMDVKIVVDALPSERGSRGSLSVSGMIGGTSIRLNDRFEGPFIGWTGARHDLSVQLSQEDPAILARQLSLPVLPLRTDGPLTMNAEFNGETSSSFQTLIAANAPGSDFSVNGRLSLGERVAPEPGALPEFSYTAELTLGTQDIDEWLLLAGISLPGMGEGTPVSLTADIAKEGGRHDLKKIVGQVSGLPISGELAIDTDRPGRPKIEGTINVDEIELASAAEIVLGHGSAARNNTDGIWPSQEFSAPFLAGLDGNIDLNAKKLTFLSGEPARNLHAALTIIDGSATLSPFSLDWAEAKISGNAALKNLAGNAVFSTQIHAVDLDAAKITNELGFLPAVSGKADLNLKLDGTGRSIQGLISNLSGSGIVSLKGCRFSGVTTGGFNNIMKMTNREDFEISPESILPVAKASMLTGSFAIAEYSTPFTVTRGKVGVRNLAMSDPKGSVAGVLELSLADLETEIELTVTLDPGEEALSGAEPEAKFNWSGKPGDLVVSADTAALQGYLSLRAYEREQRRVEILQAKALENQRLRREIILANARINHRDRKRAEELKRLEEIQQNLEKERLKRETEEAEKAIPADEVKLLEEEEATRRANEESANAQAQDAVPAAANTKVEKAVPKVDEADTKLQPDKSASAETSEPPIEIIRPPENTGSIKPAAKPEQEKPNSLFESLQRLFRN